MSINEQSAPDPALDRLVQALVMWGATASQIVAHMEHAKRSGASRSQASTVEAFTSLVGEIARPAVTGRGIPLEQAAMAIELIDEEVSAEVLLVDLPAARPRPRHRRRPR